MRHCSKARRWFGAYWDDEITQAEREWLEAHFAACTKCRGDYDRFAQTLESVASLTRIEAAPGFRETIRDPGEMEAWKRDYLVVMYHEHHTPVGRLRNGGIEPL